MLLYNVTIKIDADVHEEWLEWMRKEHIPRVIKTGKFTSHRVCRLLHEEEDGHTYAIQYFSKDLETFQRYQKEDALRLQKEHADRFPNKYVAFRTLMEVL